MGNRWTVNDYLTEANKLDKFEWRLPFNRDEHGEQTVAPGDLLIKPSQLELKPTMSPKRSGIQHGQDDWTYANAPDPGWYIIGGIVQEDD
jgi:hypothetical protein